MSSLFVSDPKAYQKLKHPFGLFILGLMMVAFINALFTKNEIHQTTHAYITNSKREGDTLKINYIFRLGAQEYKGNQSITIDTFKHDPEKLFLLKPYAVYSIEDPNQSRLLLNK